MAHKAGFVNIIGKPNAGKSTLMNALVGEKLSIITAKVQTTRHRIMGTMNDEGHQIVFSDTPGIIKPHYKMQEGMMEFVRTALQDADIILYIADVNEKVEPDETNIIEKIGKMERPIILVLNKIDLSSDKAVEEAAEAWQNLLPKAEVFPVSALHNFNLKNLRHRLLELLPESPPYFPKDQLTDKPERFFVSEIIREKILLLFKKEIPYAAEVQVDSFKEAEDIIRIHANIHVLRDSQKGIILGHRGKAIKRLGTEARKDIEAFLQKKVFLDLTVKVSKDWREKESALKRFGYLQ